MTPSRSLPALGAPLLGRDDALAALSRAVGAGDARLVTVTGTVGVGKSFFALGALHALRADGTFATVRRCDASAVARADELEACVAHALGASEGAAGAAAATGATLLLLDDADALDRHAVARLASMLDEAPELTLLLTRWARLGLADETVIALAPFEVPDGDAPAGPAAELFAWHACRVRPDYGPSAADAPFVAELLRELDGLPLAIALAAPRLSVMGAAALLHRTKQSRSVLAAPDRRGFDAALESAWQALTAWERDALAQLSTTPCFTAALAEQIALLEPGGPRTLDALQTLRERALVSPSRVPGAPGDVVLEVLRGVRDFARRKTEPARLAGARERHAACMASLARRALASRDAPLDEASRLGLLAVVRGALGDAAPGAREAEHALWSLLALSRGSDRAAEAGELSLLSRVLDATQGSGAHPALYARALGLRGSRLRAAGDPAAAARDLGKALHVARTAGDLALVGWLELETAELLAGTGDLPQAAAFADAAASTLGALHDGAGEARAILCGARIDGARGDVATALAKLDRAVALATRATPRDACVALTARARARLDAGFREKAREDLARAGEAGAGAPHEREAALLALALCLHDEGDLRRAAAGYAECAGRARGLGATAIEGACSLLAALIAIQHGELGEAFAELRAASALLVGEDRLLASTLLGAVRRLSTGDARETRALPSACSPRTMAIVRLLDAVPDGSALAALGPHVEGDTLGRLTLRALEAALGERPRVHAEGALVVGPEGRWFRPPHGEPQSLARRRPLADILARLATARQETPGAPLGWEALRDAAWPGERMQASAAAHRVRVALSTLRKLGLRDQLLSTQDGYALDPACPFARAEEP